MTYDNVLIVVNYNDAKTTIRFIQEIQQNSGVQKIVVVDNCSTDGAYEEIKEYSSEKIDVIKSEKNGGYAYGNNFGIRYAINCYNPRICFVSNPDVSFDNDTIIDLQKCLNENKQIGILAPIVNQGYNVWNLPTFIGVIESLFLVWFNLHKLIIKKHIMKSQDNVVKVGVVEGSFFAISVTAFNLINGFDERTFLYYEENIIAKRIYKANLEIAVLKNSKYDHFHSVSISKQYKSKVQAFKLFYPSILLYLKEYLHVGKVKESIFHMAFGLAYLERYVYDWIKNK